MANDERHREQDPEQLLTEIRARSERAGGASGWAAQVILKYPDGYRPLPSLVHGIQRDLLRYVLLVRREADGMDVLYWLPDMPEEALDHAASEFEVELLGRLGLQQTAIVSRTFDDRRKLEAHS